MAAIKFVPLGGVWLDEIWAPGKAPVTDVPGGSVAFGKCSLTSGRLGYQHSVTPCAMRRAVPLDFLCAWFQGPETLSLA
jgi:hypothetical protein